MDGFASDDKIELNWHDILLICRVEYNEKLIHNTIHSWLVGNFFIYIERQLIRYRAVLCLIYIFTFTFLHLTNLFIGRTVKMKTKV